MQKLDILGVELTDCALKEALAKADEFVRNGALNTVLFVTTATLVKAGKDVEEQRRISEMDLTILADADILRVAGLGTKVRIYETENQIMIKEFLRRMKQGFYSVYLLSDSNTDLEELEEQLRLIQSELNIAGALLIHETTAIEEVANKINDIAPTVIFSRITSGRQEKLMLEAKPYINAEVWVGLPVDLKLGGIKESIQKRALRKIYRTIFRSRYQKYQNKDED